ncbi:MAG: HAMP domain-containing histidine kinase [Burkholderiaceae bacterium]|nr:HAMP domain-containing histidine kinase [Burkholderiaceae bacterium]
MRSLYWRIYLTLVLLLAAFAFGSAWLFQHQIEQERGGFDAVSRERLTAMALLLQRALPSADAPREVQAAAIGEWGQHLRMAFELLDAQGNRIGASSLFDRRQDILGARNVEIPLQDGRRIEFLRVLRPPPGFARAGQPPPPGNPAVGEPPVGRPGGPGGPGGAGGRFGGQEGEDWERMARLSDSALPRWLPVPGGPLHGTSLILVLLVLFLGVALGAFPVVRRLTRRLEVLKAGVLEFGAGQFSHRVDDSGKDEVADLARSFNRAAGQIETLLRSHQSLLANASHELRSPLARLKMAFSMLDAADGVQRQRLQDEIHTNIAELDALVEEVLLASRLDSVQRNNLDTDVDLLPLAAEEAARAGAELDVPEGLSSVRIHAEERLLRRALRNLLDNARRYGGPDISVEMTRPAGWVELAVCDRGPGVPENMRERVFEAFFRLPGHAEQAGGVGLGLSLVRQIAERYHGRVRCEARPGGGSRFVLSLPERLNQAVSA